MNKYNFEVVIYSNNNRLNDLLKEVPVSEKFNMTYHTFSKATDESLAMGDIIIWNLEDKINILDEIMEKRKQSSIVILCVESDKVNYMSIEELDIFEAVWMLPVSDNMIFYQFKNIMDKLELKKELWMTQNYLDTTIDTIPDMIWYKDINGVHLKVNDSFCKAVDKTKEQITGRGHCYIWDLDMSEYEQGEYVCLETEEIVLEKKETCLFDEKVKCKDGMRLLKTYKSPVFSEDGDELLGTVGIAHDMTNLSNLYMELNIILDTMPFSVAVLDENGIIQSANKRLSDIFGVNKEQIVGLKFKELEERAFLKKIDGMVGRYTSKIPVSGEEIIVELIKEKLIDVFGVMAGYLVMVRDVTLEQKVFEKTLLDANTDYLTGLFNRRYLSEYIEANRGKHSISLLYFDVDNFKQVNDNYGHPAGDRVLIAIAEHLRKYFNDHNIFRLGGDEFLVLIPNKTGNKELKKIANDVQTSMEYMFRNEMNYPMLSVSIGIASDTEPEISPDELLKRGDAALYMAKQSGKNCICVWN